MLDSTKHLLQYPLRNVLITIFEGMFRIASVCLRQRSLELGGNIARSCTVAV
jgi:hypothetical protein